MRKPDQVPHPYPPGAQVRCIDDEMSACLKIGQIYTVADAEGWGIRLDGLPGTFSILRFERTPDADRMNHALRNIDTWVKAYPVEVFPPVDLEDCRRMLGDNLFSRLHAEWARHILDGISRYVDEGLS